MQEKDRLYTQVLIVGSGLAGCTAALGMADAGLDVLLISPGEKLGGGNSELAQGGIIYKAGQANDKETLAKDICIAGHNYNYSAAVEHLCEEGPKAVDSILIERLQVPFDKNADGSWHLTREGGHAMPRILHSADYTGASIMQALTKAVEKHPRITFASGCQAIDLLTSRHHARNSDYRYQVKNRCVGVYAYNASLGGPQTILADYTVLASGGVGNIFLHSTNSTQCVGSAISMAHRAQIALANVEFMQFHPTALYSKNHHKRDLITEAMRGEGAKLLGSDGKAFMQEYDARGDLAPRDIVSQAMVTEMLRKDEVCLYLDASSMDVDIAKRFPTVYQSCLAMGLDICKDPIPVVPAAHYFCGGILTDDRGRTELHGLYAIGECACTGLHGANRLASSSLLEALTWGHSAAKDIIECSKYEDSLPKGLRKAIPNWDPVGNEQNDDPALIAQDWANIRHTMWNYVGISRSSARLRRAFQDLRELSRHIHDFYKRTQITPALINLFHGAHTAYVITQAAMRNKQSQGCHYREDARK